MLRFAVAHLIVWSAVLGGNVVVRIDPSLTTWEEYVRLALLLCGVPTLAAWAMASLVHRNSPRKAFDGYADSRRALPGVASAVIAFFLATPAVLFVGERAHDAVILGLSSALATAVVVLVFCPRRAPGRCVQCGYDVRGSRAFGRCPECGTPFLARSEQAVAVPLYD